ncbi:MAG TPA: T9SS type A sorting domain-containing protein [Candidatus Krumholzibacteriaceae bacterium]|nr:T9SS type A sorting domain-containing protein [Candidatus Krumholzibacteriaceae bacterium]
MKENKSNAAIKWTAAAAAATLILLMLSLTAQAGEFAFITTTDYSTGSSSVIRLDGNHTTEIDVASIHSDAVSRWFDGLIYVVNKGGADNIQVLDPSSGFETLRQFSVGNESNPQDIAFISGSKAYVTRYDSNTLWIVDPSTGAHSGSIDLSLLADADGLCEMDKMIIKGSLLFITIQRLDRNNYWLPAGGSCVAVVDCQADTLIDTDPGQPGKQAIALGYENPFSNIQYNPYTDRLYVACPGSWGTNDGAVDVINPVTLQTESAMLTEVSAEGDINDVEIFSADLGYAIITNSSFNTVLISFNPSTGEKLKEIYSPGDYVINDIEISPGGELFLADQTSTDPGIRIYSAYDGSELSAGTISTGLPPFDICFSGGVQTDAETLPAAMLKQNYPNPFNPVTTIPFSLKKGCRVNISVFDAAGRRTATIADRKFTAGSHRVVWNGKDSRSRTLPSGFYFVRLKTRGFTDSKKMILLR